MSDSAPDVLTFTDVGLHYAGGTHALSGVSLTLRRGEFVAVVGPSGCGKSTLLRLAAGLMDPDHGAVVKTTDRIGFVFQDPTLLPWRSVRRNVELVGELRGLGREERRSRAAEAVRRVGLADFADHRPGMLSGGMRMRASLARTLTVRPDLFLLDEPFGAVDEITRARLGEDLLSLFVADQFAALFVTHSVAEAAFLAGRVLVMSDRPGQIIGEVPVPFEYPRSPQLRYTAEFAEVTAQVFELLAGGGAPAASADPASTDPAPTDPAAAGSVASAGTVASGGPAAEKPSGLPTPSGPVKPNGPAKASGPAKPSRPAKAGGAVKSGAAAKVGNATKSGGASKSGGAAKSGETAAS